MKKTDPSDTQPIPQGNFSSDKPIVEVPLMIGPYKIEILMQHGGMSNIYLGTDPKTKDPIIIKSLLPKFLSQNDIVVRFLREAEIIALADHPNIVKMLGHGEWKGGHYIAMEFIPGTSLRQYLLKKPMSLKKALEVLLDISYALCHLHAHGVIHRDLKPENILVSEMEEIKVIDFGIAQLLSDSEEAFGSGEKRTIGTPIYMSPEQRENPQTVSYPSDIYSLGIIAYELILGKLSYGQIHLSMMPKGIQKILNKALQSNPDDRYQDVVDLIGDLSAYLASDALEKERSVGDRLSDLFDSMKKAQKILHPSQLPVWPGIKLAMTTLSSIELKEIYTEFVHLSDFSRSDKNSKEALNLTRYAILMGEPSSKEAEGLLQCAYVRGMIHTLLHANLTAKGLASKLNYLLSSGKEATPFNFCCLILDQQLCRLQFISCGYGTLWRFPNDQKIPDRILSKNPSLGSGFLNEYAETSAEWNEGDQLLIYGSATKNKDQIVQIESLLQDGMVDYMDLTPSRQVNALLRQLNLSIIPFSSIPILIKAERKKILTHL